MESSYIFKEGQKYVPVDELINAIAENEKLKEQYSAVLSENEGLRHKSEIDPLTNVYRRSAAIEQINSLLYGGVVSCAFMVLDIDNFKHINDMFGHVYGDAIITNSAKVMQKDVGSRGIIGRFGGDEFFIFMPDADEKLAMKTARSIIEGISLYGAQSQATQHPLSCSVGVSVGSGNVTYSSLFSMADKALYYAKENGKAQAVLFDYDTMSQINEACITYHGNDEAEQNPHADFSAHIIELASKESTNDDALGVLLSGICDHFNMQRIKLLAVDMKEDKVSVLYDCKNGDEGRIRKNGVGYYMHRELTNFRDMLPNRNIVMRANLKMNDYSRKFNLEFCDGEKFHRMFYLNKSDDGDYTICFFEAAGPVRFWSKDDFSALNELSAIVMIYSDRSRHISERELALREQLNVDKTTHAMTKDYFYEQSGLVRKLAMENGLHCYAVTVKPVNFIEFNRKYTYDAGDALLKDFVERFMASEYKERGIIAHDNAHFYILVRSRKSPEAAANEIKEYLRNFIDLYKRLYPDYDLKLYLGMNEIEQDEILFHCIDDANSKRVIVEA